MLLLNRNEPMRKVKFEFGLLLREIPSCGRAKELQNAIESIFSLLERDIAIEWDFHCAVDIFVEEAKKHTQPYVFQKILSWTKIVYQTLPRR